MGRPFFCLDRVGDDCPIGATDHFSVGKSTADAERPGVSAAAKIQLPNYGNLSYNFPERGNENGGLWNTRTATPGDA